MGMASNTCLGLKRPGNHNAKLMGNSIDTARRPSDKNPKSFIGRFWRWQINFCPSWRGYFKSLPPEKQEELRKKYNFWKY